MMKSSPNSEWNLGHTVTVATIGVLGVLCVGFSLSLFVVSIGESFSETVVSALSQLSHIFG